ncbi:LytTR family DNA-binding domain-containing protein [Paraflavitalea sp. CAU 1676]|uniref:LytR/AlgR family response regulator transcription factor n=1 Tax=Paraflavitalea sp. CAU 1676 TaxID=3032598 RepID=UPI0023DBE4AC|nr:LytTR family DNA-binding domain-containing protein [Paraflavitalea sp. CAU 1676]MDF2190069.1 LytTR family DNA-binding domain-containing protein [Paraflavitalea sp. CAU 1676]
MSNITCLIVDDEPNAVQLLEDHIRKVPFLQLKAKCFDAFEVLEFLKTDSVHLIFMDINMPQLSGMDLAAMLPKEQHIIFSTAYANYALEGYEYNAVDYLLKPITFKRFMQAVAKAQSLLQPVKSDPLPPSATPAAAYIFVKSGKQLVKVEYEKILYLEALKEYVNVVTAGSKMLIYKRMKELEEQLPANFIRIHNSYIVNIDHIQHIADNQVVIDKVKLPVSASYREAFLHLVNKRLL